MLEQSPCKDSAEIERLARRMAADIGRHMERLECERPLLVGIHTGGVWVAENLRERLDYDMGQLNIAFYRDDFSRIGISPKVTPTRLPLPVEDRRVVLVDDVIHTGRTIRAALNAIFDYGRPTSVSLAILFDREGRELPIQPDFVGEKMQVAGNEHLKLDGPTPLSLLLVKAA